MGLPIVQEEAGVRWITLNRPEVLNVTLDDLGVVRMRHSDVTCQRHL